MTTLDQAMLQAHEARKIAIVEMDRIRHDIYDSESERPDRVDLEKLAHCLQIIGMADSILEHSQVNHAQYHGMQSSRGNANGNGTTNGAKTNGTASLNNGSGLVLSGTAG